MNGAGGWLRLALVPALNIALAFAVSGLVVVAIGEDPLEAMSILVTGALGSSEAIGYTLFYATNLIFTGLAVAVAFHAGLFNIGGEGQAYVGGLGIAIEVLAEIDHVAPAIGLGWLEVRVLDDTHEGERRVVDIEPVRLHQAAIEFEDETDVAQVADAQQRLERVLGGRAHEVERLERALGDRGGRALRAHHAFEDDGLVVRRTAKSMRLYTAISTDVGRTWTTPREMSSEMRTFDAAPRLFRLQPKGPLVLAYNDRSNFDTIEGVESGIADDDSKENDEEQEEKEEKEESNSGSSSGSRISLSSSSSGSSSFSDAAANLGALRLTLATSHDHGRTWRKVVTVRDGATTSGTINTDENIDNNNYRQQQRKTTLRQR